MKMEAARLVLSQIGLGSLGVSEIGIGNSDADESLLLLICEMQGCHITS